MIFDDRFLFPGPPPTPITLLLKNYSYFSIPVLTVAVVHTQQACNNVMLHYTRYPIIVQNVNDVPWRCIRGKGIAHDPSREQYLYGFFLRILRNHRKSRNHHKITQFIAKTSPKHAHARSIDTGQRSA